MAQAVSRRPVTAEAWVRSHVNPCVICGGKSGIGTGCSPSSPVAPVSTMPPVLGYVVVAAGAHTHAQSLL
jgi:hypothetical protein